MNEKEKWVYLKVNHIDMNKENNNISNLEYVTHSENQKHLYNNKESFKNMLNGYSTSNRIQVALFKDTGLNTGRISYLIKNEKTIGGYKWEKV